MLKSTATGLRASLALLVAVMLALGGGGCVSSTLNEADLRPVGNQATTGAPSQSPQDTQPQALTAERVPAETPPAEAVDRDAAATGSVGDPVKRQQAVDEIRSKAAASSGQKTQIGAVPGSATGQMSAQEQADIAAKLEDSRQATGAELSDAEVEARKAAIRRLQQKGKSHYDRALEAIEN
ncbi:hypothetical protein [Salaquimonas pukyongi]|uniref:hypothetical protein n=1 Tax=Salaquimonas pukyongi TaxID=2712698 RepID=UPI00096BC208|nr:hypothetical protein [Salaquimonas pukyongi]